MDIQQAKQDIIEAQRLLKNAEIKLEQAESKPSEAVVAARKLLEIAESKLQEAKKDDVDPLVLETIQSHFGLFNDLKVTKSKTAYANAIKVEFEMNHTSDGFNAIPDFRVFYKKHGLIVGRYYNNISKRRGDYCCFELFEVDVQ